MKHQLIFLSLFFCVVCQHLQAQEQSILRDKYAYETAAEMYAVADTAAFNHDAASMIDNITAELKKGTMLEDDKIWTVLQKLEPYRKSKQVREAVNKWITIMATPYSGNNLVDKKDINQAYQAHDFNRMIELCRRMLIKETAVSKSVDYAIRNNMALALMHQNKDLCALVELEFIKNRQEYFPAMINLTVLYERLGRSADAKALSNRLLVYTKTDEITVPMINFNAAWYMDLKNESPYDLFKVVSGFKQIHVDKYQTLAKKIYPDYKSLPVSEIGWVGKLGLDTKEKQWIEVVIYLIVSVLLCVICWKLLGLMRTIPKFFLWLIAFTMYAVFVGLSVTYWGNTTQVGNSNENMAVWASLFTIGFLVVMIVRSVKLSRRRRK